MPNTQPAETYIETVTYEVIRTAGAIIHRPIAVNGKPVEAQCADPTAVGLAFHAFTDARYQTPNGRRVIDGVLAAEADQRKAA